MESTTILGLIGGALTTVSFFPQVIKTWETRSTKDFSLGMLALLCAGLLVWTIYGFLIASLPIVLTNAISLILSLIMLALKLKHK